MEALVVGLFVSLAQHGLIDARNNPALEAFRYSVSPPFEGLTATVSAHSRRSPRLVHAAAQPVEPVIRSSRINMVAVDSSLAVENSVSQKEPTTMGTSMLTVSCDRNANIKVLRRLEREGKIELHGVAIEGHEDNRKLPNKTLPHAFIGSPFATIGNCKIVPNETPKKEIESIIGRQHHGDVLHFLDHVLSERDIFVTDDDDFLSKRGALEKRFDTKICTVEELVVFMSSE